MINDHDKNVIFAFEHIKNHPCGYMGDLDKHVSAKIIAEFKSLGFLKCGQTEDGPTYAITTFGRNYSDVILQRCR